MTDRSELEALARDFHEAYERLAPEFGYETREETRTFDPRSRNGQLMIAVCGELARRLQPARVPEGWQLVPRMATDEMLRAVSGWEETVLVAEDDHREYPVSAETFAEAYRAMLAAAPAAEGGTSEPAETDASGKYGDVIIERDERGLIQKVYRVGVIGKKLIATNPEYVAHPAPESREADKPEAGQREGVENEVAIAAHWLENISAAAALLEGSASIFDRREADALRKLVKSARKIASAQQAGTRAAWIRQFDDGTFEGPIHDSMMTDEMRQSGGWEPLYQSAPQTKEASHATSCVHHDFSVLESYIRNLRWAHDTPNEVREAVTSNLRGMYAHLLARGLFAGSGSWDAGRMAAAKWVEQRRCAYGEEFGLIDPATGVLEFGSGYPEREEYYSELSVIEEAIRTLPAPQFVAHETAKAQRTGSRGEGGDG